jgi:hypothetical protein
VGVVATPLPILPILTSMLTAVLVGMCCPHGCHTGELFRIVVLPPTRSWTGIGGGVDRAWRVPRGKGGMLLKRLASVRAGRGRRGLIGNIDEGVSSLPENVG